MKTDRWARHRAPVTAALGFVLAAGAGLLTNMLTAQWRWTTLVILLMLVVTGAFIAAANQVFGSSGDARRQPSGSGRPDPRPQPSSTPNPQSPPQLAETHRSAAQPRAATPTETRSGLPAEVLTALAADNAVVVCGSELSARAGLPADRELAETLSGKMTGFDGDPSDLPQVAAAYAAVAGRHALLAYLAGALRTGTEPTPLHVDLAHLPFAAYVTSTWDDLLEAAMTRVRRPSITVTADTHVPFATREVVPIIKIRGSIDRPETVLISEGDTQSVFARHPGIATMVSSYFASATVVFLGFGQDMAELRRIWRLCTSRSGGLGRRAYLVWPDPTPVSSAVWQAENVALIDMTTEDFIARLSAAST